jgi:hypothetical protein
MHLMYFTEQPMAAYDAKEGLKYGATALTFSNSNYDSKEASRLYNEYLEEYIMADEWGVDGIMLNEHHNAPFCMQARTNMFGAILAAVTKRAKIVFLGNPRPRGVGLRPRRRTGAIGQRREPRLQPGTLR